MLYGILHDQVTTRVCVEYFTIGHPPVFQTEEPAILAIGWGILATWWVGALLSFVVVPSCRLGAWPKVNAAQLIRPIGVLLVVMACASLLAGIAGYFAARADVVRLLGLLAYRVPAAKHHAFLADLWLHSRRLRCRFSGRYRGLRQGDLSASVAGKRGTPTATGMI